MDQGTTNFAEADEDRLTNAPDSDLQIGAEE
jgi:hypothetical protein